MNTNLSSNKKVYFIGIGGIGVSALTRKYLSDGYQVFGSDRSASKITKELEILGVKIFLKQKTTNITTDIDLVIYTIAISGNHPELVRARKLGIKTLSYPEALGELSKTLFTIAISGTHGKTTTTAMLAKIFVDAELDPTVIIGSNLLEQKSNFIAGKSKYFIVEACEYRRSFLNLSPQILVITNIDNDHLDYYHDLAGIQNAFSELASKIPSTGVLICDIHDSLLVPVIATAHCQVIDYRQFDQIANQLSLKVPGVHNRLNAAAALAVGKLLRIPSTISHTALQNFRGTWRRLEYLGCTRQGARLYDDYGHHPTEIKVTLNAIRCDFKPKRLIVIFQPHLYSRTKLLFKEFTESFNDADKILVLPIYAAREPRDPAISSRILASAIPRATYVSNIAAVERHLTTTDRRDIILTLGAGDVFVVGEKLRYNQRKI